MAINNATPTNTDSLLLPKQRQLEILSILDEAGSVRVTSLAQRFTVAEETIRRDLEKLSSEGLLSRTHGGAVGARREPSDLPIGVRRTTNAPQKRRIARLALTHIEADDVLAIDASTTALELACLLPDLPLTVVTNAIYVVRTLIDRPKIRVICTGGDVDSVSVCSVGPIAEATFRQFAVTKAFLSCNAINPNRGYSEASTSHAQIKRAIIESADQAFLLADSSKFGARSVTYFGRLSEVDRLITDDGAASDVLQAFSTAAVGVDVARSATTTRQASSLETAPPETTTPETAPREQTP